MSASGAGGGSLAGTGSLVRLALRRDRVSLPIWIVLLGMIPASSASGYAAIYPTEAERQHVTRTIGANPSLRVLYGPGFDLSTAGGFTAWRLGGFLALAIGLMAAFSVTRHTRADEDSGRAELVGATAVGRRAPLAAAVLVAAGASAAIGITGAVALQASGSPAGGSWALGLATAGAGLTFAGAGAVAAQLGSSSRSANAWSAATVGTAFLLRAVGDASAVAPWLSWCSPIGWAQQIRPFAEERWWTLLLPVAAAAVLVPVAFALLDRRDLGAGILPPRPGPSRGGPRLGSAAGLAWRLQRGGLLGWLVGAVVAGATFGSIADGIGDLVGTSEQSRQIFDRLGGSAGLTDAFLASLVSVFAMTAAFAGVAVVLHLRSEEEAGRLEPILATGVGRLRWAAGHIGLALVGSALVVVAGSAAMGATAGLRNHDPARTMGRLAGAGVAQLPAVWLVVAITVALVGLLPRQAAGAWGVAGAAAVISLLGPVFDLPQLVLDLSPFGHTPKLPGGGVRGVPLVILTLLALAVAAVGLAGLRRRDLA